MEREIMSLSQPLVVFIAGGALALGAAAPAAADDGPLLSGTYTAVGQYRAATAGAVLHISSKCPGCDAVATADNGNSVVLKWTGAGWTSTATNGGCGPTETVITPSNPTGLVQNYTSVMTFLTPEVCGTTEPGLSNGTRVGD
jgi:hypothetical protein